MTELEWLLLSPWGVLYLLVVPAVALGVAWAVERFLSRRR